jgi:hypothetical protein
VTSARADRCDGRFVIRYDKWELAQRVLAPGGRFVTIAGDSQGVLTVGPAARPTVMARLSLSDAGRLLRVGGLVAYRTISSWFGAPSYSIVRVDPNHADLAELRAAVEAGHVRALLDKTFDFTDEGACGA